jgi:hypothetical protein
MKILAEIHPKKKLEKLSLQLEDLLSSFDGIDIPDSPMGFPSPLPISVATLARRISEQKEIIINQRLADVNELYVRSLSITSRIMNLRIAFTRGDPPKFGKEIGCLKSEDAVRISKEQGVSSGIMLSFNKGLIEMERRARSLPEADFYFLLRVELNKIFQIDKKILKKSIPYIIVRTEGNSEIIKEISQPFIDESDLVDHLAVYKRAGVMGVLISTLGHNGSLFKLAKRI